MKKHAVVKCLVLVGIAVCLAAFVSCTTPEIPVEEHVEETVPSFNDYSIVMPKGCCIQLRNAVAAIADGISDQWIRSKTDEHEREGLEIIIGYTNRPESKQVISDLGPFDYKVKVMDNGNIVVNGGTEFSAIAAAEGFLKLVQDGTFTSPIPGYCHVYRFNDHNEPNPLADRNSDAYKAVVNDWLSKRTSPEWGGYDRSVLESLYAMTHKYTSTKGRIAVFAHRGDMENYPENSVGGMISAILSGVDSLEFDVRLTADYIPVVYHDADLAQFTDVSLKKGKNGLPDSTLLADWTYDQLCQLRMRDYNGRITDFRIANVCDAFKATAGLIQVSFDDKTNIDVTYENTWIPIARAADACQNLIYILLRKNQLSSLLGYVDPNTLRFAEQCLVTGKAAGSYAFYNDPIFTSWGSDYRSLNESASYWDYVLGLGKRFIGTNRCYEISLYMRDKGMKAWQF